ncbi:MAG: hypothetical protein AB7I38_05240 [Dehalococcoidia bacterium]
MSDHGGTATRPAFYESALSRAERDDFGVARSVDGLQEEIAILRLRLREALGEHPGDLDIVERGVRLLVQSLLAEHRLSSKEARNITETLTGLAEQLMVSFTEQFE